MRQVVATSTPDGTNGGVYFVPAFGGLFAPHWRSDARGVIVGLSGHAGREHIVRAALESTAFQVRPPLAPCPLPLTPAPLPPQFHRVHRGLSVALTRHHSEH